MNTSNPIVITPYYKEDPSLLRRCIDSVQRQTVPTEHLLVADGHPQDWIDLEPVRHLKLDRPHGDFGNTPRGVGALMAAAEGHPAIVMLDADNWLQPEHIEVCLRIAESKTGTDFVVARRTFRRPDESIMPVPEEPVSAHVDTSCFVFLPGSYHVLPVWALIPKEMSTIGDRLFWMALKGRGLSGVIITDHSTVNYHCLWEMYYRALGELPPPGAKPNIDSQRAWDWWRSLGEREQQTVQRLIGVPWAAVVPPVRG
jgi:glycosyltransferase involved in cell wall biosynthesis